MAYNEAIETRRRTHMDIKHILSMVDHTLLKPETTWKQIKGICDDAMKYHTATVCIPASYVARCKAYMQDRADKVGVCTVIGFPNGELVPLSRSPPPYAFITSIATPSRSQNS